MSRSHISRSHIVLPFAAAVACAAAAIVLVPRGLEAGRVLAAQDDPNAAAEHYLEQNFSAAVADREVAAALAAGDVDLAQSFVTLAQDRGVAVDPALADRLAQARSNSATASRWSSLTARVTRSCRSDRKRSLWRCLRLLVGLERGATRISGNGLG